MRSFKIFFSAVISLLLVYSCKGAGNVPESNIIKIDPTGISIIPKPHEIFTGTEHFALPAVNTICVNPGAEEASEWLQKLLKRAKLGTQIKQGNSCGTWNLAVNNTLKDELGEEGYTLEINSQGIFMKAASQAGLFYAIQTMRQILPASLENDQFDHSGIQLPHMRIKDVPDHSWRGSMVDISRSFFGLEYLKAHVDRMALYKMNRLHLHLTDDQGWRIEIKSKPKLTEIGSKGAVLNGRSGYLTQQEYINLQTYAAARNIIIIPEIDMPGHIYSALVSYPELNCDEFANIEPRMATPPELFSGTKVGWSKLCLTKPEIYDFVSDVIGEMAAITTGPWIHIGGDEIKDDLYQTFVIKADSIVQHHGKTAIGWEEVTKAKVSNSLISQKWHGKVKSVVDVKFIESVCTSFYFDHANIPGQEKTNNWCKKSGVSLEEVYVFKNNDPNLLGYEAPVWTEFVWTDEELDNRYWPRTIAVAEMAWNDSSPRNYTEFKDRLGKHGERLSRMGVNYYPTPELNWSKNTNSERSGIFQGYLPKPDRLIL